MLVAQRAAPQRRLATCPVHHTSHTPPNCQQCGAPRGVNAYRGWRCSSWQPARQTAGQLPRQLNSSCAPAVVGSTTPLTSEPPRHPPTPCGRRCYCYSASAPAAPVLPWCPTGVASLPPLPPTLPPPPPVPRSAVAQPQPPPPTPTTAVTHCRVVWRRRWRVCT